MSNNTITKFIGDISFNNGENDVLVSDLTTVNEVNEALSELKSQLDNTYAMKTSLSSYYNKTEADDKYVGKNTNSTINGNIVISTTENSNGFNYPFKVVAPNINDGHLIALTVGKSFETKKSTFLFYQEPGIGGLCLHNKPDIITFTDSYVHFNEPTTINGNLLVIGEIKQNNDPVITKEQFNTYGMCYSTTFSKYNKPIGASTISTSGFTLKLNDDNTAVVFTNNTKKLTRDVVVLRVYDSSGSMHTLWIDYVNRIVKSDDVSSDIPLDTLIRDEISIPIDFTTTRTILEGQTMYYTYQVRSEEVGDKLNALIRSSS